MGACQIYPWALAAGANVISASAFQANTARQTGVQAGKASSQVFNTAMRQSLFVASGFANWVAQYGQTDVLDNADLAGFIAKISDAMGKFVKQVGINIGAEPPSNAVPGMLWLNTGSGTWVGPFERVPAGGLAVFYGLTGWKWLAGGQRLFVGQQQVEQSILPTTIVNARVSGANPPWGQWDGSTGKLKILVAGEYYFSFYTQVNVSFSQAPEPGMSAFAAQIMRNGAFFVNIEVPFASAGFQPDGSTPGYVFSQECSMPTWCDVNDTIEAAFYLFNPSNYVTNAFSMQATTFRAERLS